MLGPEVQVFNDCHFQHILLCKFILKSTKYSVGATIFLHKGILQLLILNVCTVTLYVMGVQCK